ncbi:F-box domain-containing protein [Heracleum sosnowskyi]|uniref:F-box domain-containing protein n=1 Tax=Heracleum sosnowskyi TaxID=360622 RepID=A0AAD8IVF1_9APIA|nr:F-box domain-containing protein [Heracleum sosnowskyi]
MALPCEMIDEILCRLSVKNLLRCRCVSKEWCSLIDSTAFVKKHLKTSRDCNAGFGLLMIKLGGDTKFYLASLDSLDEDSVVKIKNPLKTFLYGAEIVGASNGLMCVFKNDRKDVFLLNPIMRKSKKIAPAPPEFPSLFRRKERHIYGFGYDEVNDDYKVVMIAECYVKFRGLIVIVYSFKTNAWTRIQNVPKNIHFTGTRGVFASGSLHWLAFEKRSNSKDIILGFDLELQQFKEVPFPPIDMTRDSSKSRFLADVGEYLCILDRPSYHVNVWLMNYPGAQSTWYKALSTGQEEIRGTMRSNELIAFSRSGKDVLLQVCNPHYTKLAWYNLNRETVKNAGIRGLPFNFCSFLYTESLLQLTEDEPLQQKPSEDKQKKNKNKRRRDEFMSEGSSLGL